MIVNDIRSSRDAAFQIGVIRAVFGHGEYILMNSWDICLRDSLSFQNAILSRAKGDENEGEIVSEHLRQILNAEDLYGGANGINAQLSQSLGTFEEFQTHTHDEQKSTIAAAEELVRSFGASFHGFNNIFLPTSFIVSKFKLPGGFWEEQKQLSTEFSK